MAAELGIGEITLRDIVKELEKPARDPRDDMPKPIPVSYTHLFGGTSVANKERIFNVANRCIEEYRKGNDVVVVPVSYTHLDVYKRQPSGTYRRDENR